MIKKIKKLGVDIQETSWRVRYITLAIIFIFLISFFTFDYFWSKQNRSLNIDIPKVKTISEADKLKILDELAKMGTSTISVKEKKQILDNLKSNPNTTITNEEKLKILEALKNNY